MFIYLILFLIPFAVTFWELSLAQEMTFYLGNTVLWYAMTMGVYLLALSLGWLRGKAPFKKGKDYFSFSGVILFLAMLGGMSVIFLRSCYVFSRWLQIKTLHQVSWIFLFSLYFFIVFMLAFICAYFSSVFLSRHQGQNHNTMQHMSVRGRVSACMAFALCLWSPRDLLCINLILGLFLVLCASILLWIDRPDKKVLWRAGISLLSVVFLLALCLGGLHEINQFFLKDFYYNLTRSSNPFNAFVKAEEYPAIERHNFSYHHFDIVKVPQWAQEQERPILEGLSAKYLKDPQFPKGYMFFLDGNFIMRSDHEEFHNEFLVHIPIILNKRIPQRVLIIENGVGLIAREVAKYNPVREITQLSLCAGLNSLAQKHPLLRYMNGDVFEDRRLFVKTTDAFAFLKNTKDTYDAIYIDVPPPNRYAYARFYSREFFGLVKKHLNKDGFVVFEAPGNAFLTYYDERGFQALAEDNKWEYYYATLAQAGFKTIRPYLSNLELSHPEAAEKMLLSFFSGDSMPEGNVSGMIEGEVKELAVKESILQYVYALQEGFIMLKAFEGHLDKKYHTWVDLYALDKTRFRRSRLVYYPVPDRIDQDKIHSILRPTLTNLSWWGL